MAAKPKRKKPTSQSKRPKKTAASTQGRTKQTQADPPKSILKEVLDMDSSKIPTDEVTIPTKTVRKRGNIFRKLSKYVVLKPQNERLFFGLLKNDLEFVDTEVLSEKIHAQSHFSVLYLALLVSSVVVCTLGLLMDSTAIVIGGMLIAPLMWPLARLGYGIALRSPIHLYRGAVLVGGSILIGAISAYMITTISPIKVINDEILARTAPTIMDLFIALAAGFVAAVAITQKKIADSLAGVAIAVSLMPPLCTVGIALSLRNLDQSLGALLLFAVNAACIVLVTTAALVYIEYQRSGKIHIAKRAAILNVLVIVAMAVPLVQFLRSHTFALSSYEVVSDKMSSFIASKDSAATFENIEISNDDDETLRINADLLLPSESVFSYEDNEALVSDLEQSIDKDVLLNLRIQNIIEPISKNQRENERSIDRLRGDFATELTSLSEDMRISSISISEDAGVWLINADVFTSPDSVPTNTQVSGMSERLSSGFGSQVDVDVTFVPRLTLRSTEQTKADEARDIVDAETKGVSTDAQVSMFTLSQSGQVTTFDYVVTTTQPELFEGEYLQDLKDRLGRLLDGGIALNVRVVSAQDLSL